MFTKLQKDEIIPLIEIRQDTIDDDPDSASGIELIPGALNQLKNKIESNIFEFTDGEKEFLIGEFEARRECGEANSSHDNTVSFVRSMQNAINKLK